MLAQEELVDKFTRTSLGVDLLQVQYRTIYIYKYINVQVEQPVRFSGKEITAVIETHHSTHCRLSAVVQTHSQILGLA